MHRKTEDEKIQLYHSYYGFLNSLAGMDLTGFLNSQYQQVFNQFALEPVQRQGGIPDEVLRGRLQMIGFIKSHIEFAMQEGTRAQNKLAQADK